MLPPALVLWAHRGALQLLQRLALAALPLRQGLDARGELHRAEGLEDVFQGEQTLDRLPLCSPEVSRAFRGE